MTEDDAPLVIVRPGRRGRGRPAATEPKMGLTAWVPVRDHARLQQIATRREVSLSTLVRELLQDRLKP